MENWHTGISNKAHKKLTDARMQSIEGLVPDLINFCWLISI